MANFESGYRSILGAKLAPADVTMTVATPPTVTSGRLYLNNGAQEERIKFTGVSGNTLTGLVRGLSKTADPATAGTGLTWIAGQPVLLVDMHDQLWDESKTETITGDKTFTGDNVHNGTETFNGIVNMGALGDLNVLGKSNPAPVVADDTARDALYTSPLTNDRVYNVAAQAEQVYNGSNRDTYGVSTPTPNASEAVAGKVQLNKAAAGDDIGSTGAGLVPLMSDVIRYSSEIAGENISVSGLTAVSLLPDGKVYKLSGDKRNLGSCPGTQIVVLSDTTCVAFARSSGTINGYVGTISGNSVTFGTAQSIVTDNYSDRWKVCKLDTNKLLLVYNSSTTVTKAVGIDLTTGTLSAGSGATIQTSVNDHSTLNIFCENIDTNKGIIVYGKGGGNGYSGGFGVVVCSISGVALTFGAAASYHQSYEYIYKNLTTYGNKFAITGGYNETYNYSFVLVGTISGLTLSIGAYNFPVVSGNNKEYKYNTAQKIFFDNDGTTLYLGTNASSYGIAQIIKFTLSGTTLTRGAGYAITKDWNTSQMIILDRLVGIREGTNIQRYTKGFSSLGTNAIGISATYISEYRTNNYAYVSNAISGNFYKISNELFLGYGIIKDNATKDGSITTYLRGAMMTTTGLTKGGKYFVNYGNGSLILDTNTGIEAGMASSTTNIYITL